MIITHTRNADGHRRIYIGGKASLECWIEPADSGAGWTFQHAAAVTGQPLSEADIRVAVAHSMRSLSEALSVSTDALHAVPFETIARLHTTDPFIRRRMAQGRRRTVEQGFVAAAPLSERASSSQLKRPGEPVERL
jgi:hypothetical protein